MVPNFRTNAPVAKTKEILCGWTNLDKQMSVSIENDIDLKFPLKLCCVRARAKIWGIINAAFPFSSSKTTDPLKNLRIWMTVWAEIC